jgi:hypothetical protein
LQAEILSHLTVPRLSGAGFLALMFCTKSNGFLTKLFKNTNFPCVRLKRIVKAELAGLDQPTNGAK